MKHPISWHEEWIQNRLLAIRLLEDEIAARQMAVNARMKDVMDRKEQVALAKKRGVTAFDKERFGKKRSKA